MEQSPPPFDPENALRYRGLWTKFVIPEAAIFVGVANVVPRLTFFAIFGWFCAVPVLYSLAALSLGRHIPEALFGIIDSLILSLIFCSEMCSWIVFSAIYRTATGKQWPLISTSIPDNPSVPERNTVSSVSVDVLKILLALISICINLV